MAGVDFAESEEPRALRSAVAGIAAKFGPRYYAEHAAARRPCDELWQALGDAGFIGVNIPEEYGGGGGGLTELPPGFEEIAAARTAPLLLRVTRAAPCLRVPRDALGAPAGNATNSGTATGAGCWPGSGSSCSSTRTARSSSCPRWPRGAPGSPSEPAW